MCIGACQELLAIAVPRQLPGAAEAAEVAHSCTVHAGPVRSFHPAVSCSLRAQQGGGANALGEGCHLSSHTFEIGRD